LPSSHKLSETRKGATKKTANHRNRSKFFSKRPPAFNNAKEVFFFCHANPIANNLFIIRVLLTLVQLLHNAGSAGSVDGRQRCRNIGGWPDEPNPPVPRAAS